MRTLCRVAVVPAVLLAVVACSSDQREQIDSAAGAAGTLVRSTLSVIDLDMGRHIGADKKISDETETFAPSDTIYASVHTSGLAKQGEVAGRWTFPDNSVVDQQAEAVTTEDGYLAFFITKPGGLAPGKYKFDVIVNGHEVRSSEVTVQ